MTSLRRFVRAALLFTLLSLCVEQVEAQQFFGIGAFPMGGTARGAGIYGYNSYGSYTSPYVFDFIPYFAAHPPVYYEYGPPLRRFYGKSPFAYGPDPSLDVPPAPPRGYAVARNNGGDAPVPKRITNPYVTGAAAELPAPSDAATPAAAAPTP